MTVARFRVVRAGPLTTIQDSGRPGWRRFGVPPSGPVDTLAFAAANAALGNPPNAVAIELSQGGVDLACEEGTVAIAVTGAARLAIDSIDVGGWTTAIVEPGMRLRLRVEGGNWGYLALAGEIVAADWLTSRSTHLLAGLGGGRIVAGATIAAAACRDDLATGAIAAPHRPALERARVVVGPQQRFFAADAVVRLTGEAFAASARFDRMGLVLDGPAIRPTRIDMPSEPTLRGALQADGDGRLTLLGADHQTTGGYPRLATLLADDAERAAQLPAGAPLRFDAVAPAQAVEAARAIAAERVAYLAAVASAVRPRLSLFEVNLIGGAIDALAVHDQSATPR